MGKRDNQINSGSSGGRADIQTQVREAAYQAWLVGRVDWQDKTLDFFHRTYLGHYASVQHYAQSLLDRYELDSRLAAAIEQPYRQYVSFNVPAFAQHLLDSDQIYTIDAVPVGLWIFNGEID